MLKDGLGNWGNYSKTKNKENLSTLAARCSIHALKISLHPNQTLNWSNWDKNLQKIQVYLQKFAAENKSQLSHHLEPLCRFLKLTNSLSSLTFQEVLRKALFPDKVINAEGNASELMLTPLHALDCSNTCISSYLYTDTLSDPLKKVVSDFKADDIIFMKYHTILPNLIFMIREDNNGDNPIHLHHPDLPKLIFELKLAHAHTMRALIRESIEDWHGDVYTIDKVEEYMNTNAIRTSSTINTIERVSRQEEYRKVRIDSKVYDVALDPSFKYKGKSNKMLQKGTISRGGAGSREIFVKTCAREVEHCEMIRPLMRNLVIGLNPIHKMLFMPVGSPCVGPLSEYELQKLIIDILVQIQILKHDARFIHNDIKPSNIVKYENHWYLIDFEIAHVLDTIKDDKCYDLDDNVVVNRERTNGYIAPEKLSDGHVSPKSDIYSFGVMLNKMFEHTLESLPKLKKLVDEMMIRDVRKRVSVEDCLKHFSNTEVSSALTFFRIIPRNFGEVIIS
ncbi:hypothetical protein C9374_002787 [Naegleria lovaniensis]|uniref:non-specific serine/threonine protein kinase n=1 Tax=Naegleria lovaniensis TaxID=51637 RepID=A0AA88GQ61_NAELO|nr:uncharacterized protein C9374_002787 [Naegleria lovaniensis]KAG2386341.1 hypothetical protein C9374_002787 [Naegleria lovaniensis]